MIYFTSAEELLALREEFQHHQDKLDQFYSLMSEVEKRSSDDDAESKNIFHCIFQHCYSLNKT